MRVAFEEVEGRGRAERVVPMAGVPVWGWFSAPVRVLLVISLFCFSAPPSSLRPPPASSSVSSPSSSSFTAIKTVTLQSPPTPSPSSSPLFLSADPLSSKHGSRQSWTQRPRSSRCLVVSCTPQNQMQSTATSVQIVSGMPFLLFDFGV